MASAHTLRGDHRQASVELASAADLTDRRLRELFEVERQSWSDVEPRLAEPVELLADLVLTGGKRLRPAFCFWGHRAVTGDAELPPMAVDLGAALELLHAFALAHDDVMDASPSRRGRPTTHAAQADRHRERGWRGDPDRFGENVAILVGDLGHTFARRLLAGMPATTVAMWDALETELVLGQYLDVSGAVAGSVPLDQALRIADLKSARYTVAKPLALGATLGGCERVPPSLATYGTSVGLAYQLRDDMLGACGSSAVTGKPVGDDLREGKPTPLAAAARQRATASQAEVLDQIGTAGIDVATVLEVLHATGAVREMERTIEELTAEGVAAVTGPDAGIDPQVGHVLAEIASLLCDREA